VGQAKRFNLKYLHLIGLLGALYAIALLVTRTDPWERTLDTLRRYCLSDYVSRNAGTVEKRFEAEFYREEYGRRLDGLTAGVVDRRDGEAMRRWFEERGFGWASWSEGNGRSCVLAPILSTGRLPNPVAGGEPFDWFVLGEKKIVPFLEFARGPKGRVFVTGEEGRAYIHRDSVEPHLLRYFERAWERRGQNAEDLHWDSVSWGIYRDMEEVCKDVFLRRIYRDPAVARRRFVESGFYALLPTLLAMGETLAAPPTDGLTTRERYGRAVLHGLAQVPSHTLFQLLAIYGETQADIGKIWTRLQSLAATVDPKEMKTEEISLLARRVLAEMEREDTRSVVKVK
jgi:hypothetical protein